MNTQDKDVNQDEDEPRCPRCGETKANHGNYATGEDWTCPDQDGYGRKLVSHSVEGETMKTLKDQSGFDEHVAWCCYTYDEGGGIQSIETCSSNEKGAFRVYRAPLVTASRAKTAAQEIGSVSSKIICGTYSFDIKRAVDVILKHCSRERDAERAG